MLRWLKQILRFAEKAAPDLAFAFGLAPKKAVEYFESKGYAVSWDWWDTWQEAHARAFTVAKVTKMEILQDIRASVDSAIREGKTLATFRKELEPKLKAHGWWGLQKVVGPDGTEREVMLGSPWRLRTIYRTNTQTALNVGRWREFAENAGDRPYLQFVAVLDSKTRNTHRALHGKVFHIDDPIWDTHAPPLDWGCRCRLRALSKEDVEAKGLKVESSEGRLSKEDRLVSEATGELRPITIYTDPKTGSRVSTGVGWDYNPGKVDFKPDTARFDKPLVEAFDQEVKKAGLVHRFPVKTQADVEKVIAAFDQENPGIFQKGFKRLTVTRTDAFLSTNRYGEMNVSNKTDPDLDNFNPARELRTALKKIGKGEALTFNEEYSLEGLWHEMGHCRSTGWVNLRFLPKSTLRTMETLNQWMARRTYPEFIEKLGGKAAHQEAILEKGYGYEHLVRNFRALLKALEVDEGSATDLLKPVAFETSWDLQGEAIGKRLAGLKVKPELAKKIEKALGQLSARPEAFDGMLKDVLGGI